MLALLISLASTCLWGTGTAPETTAGQSPAAQSAYARLSPFEMVRWNGLDPEVRVDGTWWRLESIDGVACATILSDARRLFGESWAKRFCEDLVEVLERSGHVLTDTAELGLSELGDPGARTVRRVAWSADNRRRIRDAQPRPAAVAARVADGIKRVERTRAATIPAEFEPLTQRLDALEARGGRLTREQAAADLAQLEWLVLNTYSYRDRVGFDFSAAFDAVHARLGESISRASFTLQIHRVLCGFGDGHTRVRTPTAELLIPGALPVELVRDDLGVVARGGEVGEALDDAHPYLVAIDGEPIDVWLAAARRLVPRGSSAFEDRYGLSRVVHVPHLRAERGLKSAPNAKLTLANRAGETVERVVEFTDAPLRTPAGERLAARRLAKDVGYLRIGRMDDDAEFLAQLERHLDELTGVVGLVIDVRGNGGGSRLPLLAIAPRLLPETSTAAVVVNVAALRLAPGEDAQSAGAALQDRFLFAADWKGWSPAANSAVDALASSFRPAAALAAGEFTGWHFLVLERNAQRAPITTGRVIVLQDEGCFSATDIFLGALGELPNVTLVGATSGGGSGRARGHVLAHSGIGVQLSTMASFLPDGSAYDGRGIEPDVHVVPTLGDRLGRTDTVLDRALELARAR